MTRKELVEISGSEELADFAVQVLVSNANRDSFIKAMGDEFDRQEDLIIDFAVDGYLHGSKGIVTVRWEKADSLPHGDEATEEENKLYEEELRKCQEACAAIQKKKIVSSLYRKMKEVYLNG